MAPPRCGPRSPVAEAVGSILHEDAMDIVGNQASLASSSFSMLVWWPDGWSSGRETRIMVRSLCRSRDDTGDPPSEPGRY